MRILFAFSIILFLGISEIKAQCTTVPQVNSVVNGDFEQGYIASGPGSFTSDQVYVYDPTNVPTSTKMDVVMADPTETICSCNNACAWGSDGHFNVAAYYGTFRCDGNNYDGHPFLPESDGRYDHTKGIGGTGKYLMIDTKNGAASGLGIKLWEQQANVVGNQNYYFSSWFINFSPASTGAGNKALLRFVVEAFDASNVSLGVTQLGAQFSPADASRGNNWEQAYRTWTAPLTAVTVKLGIYNQTSSILVGNDIAIDDISFTNGCQSIAGIVPPAPNQGPDLNICSTNGTITLNSNVATNAGAGRTFTWYSGTGNPQTQIVAPSTTANTLAITTPGTYRVCVYESTGGACAKSSTIVITQSQTVSLGPDVSICQPNATTVTLNAALGNTGAVYSYAWTKNASPIGGATSSSYVANSIGTYVVNVTHPTIPACNATDSKDVNNTNTMTTSLGPNVNLCTSPAANFTSSLTGSAFTYQWKRDGVIIPGATSSSYSATIPGTYTVTLVHPVTGCNVTNSASVANTNTITANNVNFCAPPATAVGLSVTGPGILNWYAGSSGGAAIATNTSTYTTPPISTTTTYYVEDGTSSSGTAFPGASAYPTQDYNYNQTMRGIEFQTLKNNVTLKTVDLWIGSYCSDPSVTPTICLRDNSGSTISSVVLPAFVATAASPVKTTFTLNFTIPVQGTYQLVLCGGSAGCSLMSTAAPSNVTDATNTLTFTKGLTLNAWESTSNYFQNITFDAGSNSCSRLPVTAYFTGSCPAPVTLISFEGKEMTKAVLLSWITTMEKDASYYSIERSYDGQNFTSIGRVKATNSSTLSNYDFTDNNAEGGLVYYRLAQYDINGTVHYSSVIVVTLNKNTLYVYPNPNKGMFTLSINSLSGNDISVELINTLGQTVHSELLSNPAGQVSKELDMRELAGGVYYLKVKSGNDYWQERIIKE
jgi:hypothetical protein